MSGAKIEAKNLIKVYRSGHLEVVALRGLHLVVREGEIISIMGPSGCGKTTLLNIIGGLDRPTAGQVFVDGRDITQAEERTLEDYRLRVVGFIFQFFNLIPDMTALENVELPLRLAGASAPRRRARAAELLSSVGLGGRLLQRPDELSGGEQQRVAIACSLANDPPLILADEPTGELDRETSKQLMGLFVSQIREGKKTSILVTHDTMVAKMTDRIVRMEDGRIIDELTPDEIAESSFLRKLS